MLNKAGKILHVPELRYFEGARWHSGRASDSESRGPGFDLHKCHCVVSLGKTH